MLTSQLIDDILGKAPDLTVGVLGDLFLDRYLDIDGSLTEPSLETGLDAYQVVRVRSCPGAAGTVLNNLVALGVGRVVPIAVIGDDGEGHELRQALAELKNVDTAHVMSFRHRRTPTYTKPMLARPGESPRELNRLDIKNRTPTPAPTEERIAAELTAAWPAFHALVVVDQVSEAGCGVVTERIRDTLRDLAESDPAKFVLADSREHITQFHGVCIKPNAAEIARAMKVPEAETAIRKLAERAGRTVFGTVGERGMILADSNGETASIPGYPVEGPVDIVGAGDCASAAIATAIAAGAAVAEAAAFACLCASITVRQIGTTGVARPEQIRARWREVSQN